MAFKTVMTAEEMVAEVKHICFDLQTKYNNKFPNNCGYNHGDYFTWDCWNFYPKTLVWGWKETIPVGSYCYKPGTAGIGDWNGWTILNCCDEISKDFSSVLPAEFLLIKDKKHAGCYVGTFSRNGRIYNVIECTSNSVIGKGVRPSWVDPDGSRRAYKGGPITGTWGWHGQLPVIDYTGVKPEPSGDVLAVDGYWGMATTRYSQKLLGTPVDGEVSNQPRSNKKYCQNASAGWEWKWVGYKGGSQMVKALQKLVGADPDGYCGRQTIMALQTFLRNGGYYAPGEDSESDGWMGSATVKAWQRYVNQRFK